MSPTTAMFWPMIAHVFLVFLLYGLLIIRRNKYTFKDRESAIKLRDHGEEAHESRLVNRNIANQFELPVLFHIACLLLYITDADNVVTVVLAWLFVLLALRPFLCPRHQQSPASARGIVRHRLCTGRLPVGMARHMVGAGINQHREVAS